MSGNTDPWADFNSDFDALERAEQAEDLRQKLADKTLTPQQLRDFGLTSTPVLLSFDRDYQLSRDDKYAYIYDVKSGRAHTIRLEVLNQAKDYYPRFRINLWDIETKVPGFISSIRPTGIFSSMAPIGKSSRAYLYRVAHALYYKQNLAWTGGANRLEVSHKDQICCHDHFANLEVLPAPIHQAQDRFKDRLAAKERLVRRYRTVQREASVEECLVEADDSVDRLIDLLGYVEAQGQLSEADRILLAALRARSRRYYSEGPIEENELFEDEN